MPAELRRIDQAEADRLIRERANPEAEGPVLYPEFQGAHFTDVRLQVSTMLGPLDFGRSVLDRVRFGGNLDDARFGQTRLSDCDLSHHNAARLFAEESVFERCDFTQSYLRRSHFKGARLDRCDFTQAELAAVFAVGASFRECVLDRANFDLAWLDSVDFTGAHCHETVFRRAHMRETNLRGVDLRGCDFAEADLRGADLKAVDLRGAILAGADLRRAKIAGAQLQGADLSHANLSGADLRGADLTGAKVYGVSAWDVALDAAVQRGLVIVPPDQSSITVDDLEVAQFVYLMYQNPKIRRVIDTITSRAVLILGRFTPERKEVLDGIREELRRRDWVPILFDFDKPTQRDFTETILTLAGMARFVIADISNPKSSPLELQATVPNYMIPFVPILHADEKPFAMFEDLKKKYDDWVLDLLVYDTLENLLLAFEPAVLVPALKKHAELTSRKAKQIVTRDIRSYISQKREE